MFMFIRTGKQIFPNIKKPALKKEGQAEKRYTNYNTLNLQKTLQTIDVYNRGKRENL